MTSHRSGSAAQTAGRLRNLLVRRVPEKVGGRARLKVIVLLACVLGLESADAATVGATAVQLEHSLNIGNPEVGLLVSVSTGIGAVATLPAGHLTDKVNRTALLAAAILTWSVALAIGGLSSSYIMLLCTRVALGAVVATAGPTVASLTGDYFPVAERGRIYGFVLSGELVGAGIGLTASGDIAAALSWRAAFWALAIPGAVLAWMIWRYLPEPARDGSWRLPAGAQRIRPWKRPKDEISDEDPVQDNRAGAEVRKQGVEPRADMVLHEDPTKKSLWWAVRYVLSVPTNRVLIASSALGFFFFSGLRTFAVVLLHGRYGVGEGAANMLLFVIGLGAILGVLSGGRLADYLLSRHRVSARPVISGICFLIAVAFFLPGLATTSLLVAAPLFFMAAAGLGGANPPLDAARLDLMPGGLWGRAEAVRTVLRYALGAVAPLLFGLVSTWLGGTSARRIGTGTHAAHAANAAQAAGLAHAFMVMLLPLLAAALLIVFWAQRTYPRDVATAVASEESVNDSESAAA